MLRRNPWTSPGASWPRYEYKVIKQPWHEWRVIRATFDPSSLRPTYEEVGRARYEDEANRVAVANAQDFARKLAQNQPVTPNPIRVLDTRGRCIQAYGVSRDPSRPNPSIITC